MRGFIWITNLSSEKALLLGASYSFTVSPSRCIKSTTRYISISNFDGTGTPRAQIGVDEGGARSRRVRRGHPEDAGWRSPIVARSPEIYKFNLLRHYLNDNPLHLIERDNIGRAVVELGSKQNDAYSRRCKQPTLLSCSEQKSAETGVGQGDRHAARSSCRFRSVLATMPFAVATAKT
jgi:hypothetical protein